MQELDRCIKCYAAKPAPCAIATAASWIKPSCGSDTSATLKGNFAWQITRLPQAGRCVGCDECTRACPAGINLRLLNLTLAEAARENFEGYRAGMEKEAAPVIGAYSQQDKENFIQ